MNTTQLKYFLELSRTLNYSTAAQQLYITQPTLSRSIMALEDELGAKLFHRESGSVSLTPAGRLFLQDMEPLAIRYDGLLQRVRNLGSGLAGEIHIALSNEQQMPDSLIKAIKAFSADHPNVEFHFSRMSTAAMMTALREEAIDLSVTLEFVGNGQISHGFRLEGILLEKEQPCLVRASVKKEPSFLPITREECHRILSSAKLVFPSPKFVGDEMANPVEPLREMLHLPELSPNVLYIRDADSVSLYVAAGIGVTIANRTHTITKENGVDVLEILGAEPYRKILQYRADSRNPVLGRFLECVMKEK